MKIKNPLLYLLAFFWSFNLMSAQNILFIGNSIFTDKQIPDKVQEYFRGTEILVDDISQDGFSLKWHFKTEKSLDALQSEIYGIWIVLGLDYKQELQWMKKLDSLRGHRNIKILILQPYSSYYPKAFRKPEIQKFKEVYNPLVKQFNSVHLIRFGEILDCYLDEFPGSELFYDNIHLNDETADILLFTLMHFLLQLEEFDGLEIPFDVKIKPWNDCIFRFDTF
ncbi:MAG: hypothetical protein R2879_07810 [Saprospiraceae bacterium]